MFYQIEQYIKFLLKSTNQHGVHSPFVYDLVTKCFYDKSKYTSYKDIINYKKSLLNNKTKIKVTDLGAGSQLMKQQERKISHIAKNAGATIKRAKLLFRLIKYFECLNTLELGTSLGIATYAISLGNKKNSITTIEGCQNTSQFTKDNLKKFQIKNIHLITGDFSTEIKKLTSNKYDFIFFDGNHQKKRL